VRLLGAAVGAGLVVAGVGGYLLVTHGSGGANAGPAVREQAVATKVPLVSAAGLADRSGVRLVRVAVSGDGGLIDLRYQVIDPDRANAVHDAKTPPTLVDERTGLVVNQLLMGHMHHGVLKAGQTYYLIFENPGNLVQRGSRVAVQLGDARVAHIRVQ
jgi:hypothetical protein